MVKAISTAAIEKATGRAWPEWCATLDRAKANDLPHGEIVKVIATKGSISGWWAQSVAVAYEQHIGRRKPGQGSDGQFTASVSRTFSEAPEKMFTAWKKRVADETEFGGRKLAEPATASRTPKRLYWRCKFADGARVTISFETKPGGKALAAVEHAGLQTSAQIEKAKTFWRKEFDEFSQKIGGASKRSQTPKLRRT
jgi:hypothetical protein